MIRGRTYPFSPKDPKAIRQINHWLAETSEQGSHTLASDQLPSRLLEIKDEGAKVNLITATKNTAKYIALSHCWGTVRPMTLTKHSLGLLKWGIETSFLPQSFQDAIWLTHRLGVQYLWIDSLCILQDSQQDWVHESARMRDIYQGSWLTIAASRASGSAEGFLGEQVHYEHISFPYQVDDMSGEIMACTVPIQIANRADRRIELGDEPLTTRGWALQERYISQRTLHFGRSQILFEHDGSVLTQDNCKPISFRDYNSMPDCGLERGDWYLLVERYSARNLTRESDKLPALGGLAAYFAPHLFRGNASTYLAGLWREDMLAGLCWARPWAHTGTRPKSYRAPSWSWAATEGNIIYPSGAEANRELAIVEDSDTSLASLDSPFGEVRGGWVRLRAILLRPQARKDWPGYTEFEFCEEEEYFAIDSDWDVEPHHEVTDAGTGETDLRFIPMAYRDVEDQSVSFVFFLIVNKAKHEVGQHDGLQGFQRVDSVIALSEFSPKAIKLAKGRWTELMRAGQMEEIILI